METCPRVPNGFALARQRHNGPRYPEGKLTRAADMRSRSAYWRAICVCVCPLAKRGNEVQRVREEGDRWTMRVFAEAEVGWLVAAGERKDERRDRGKGDCPVKGFIGIGRLDREMG